MSMPDLHSRPSFGRKTLFESVSNHSRSGGSREKKDLIHGFRSGEWLEKRDKKPEVTATTDVIPEDSDVSADEA